MEENTPFCRDTALTGYLPLPRAILDRPLSATAMLLYGVLLDRGTLSQKNGYTSPGGQVYVIYTVEHLAQTLHRGTASVKVCLREPGEGGPDPPGAQRLEPSQPYFFMPSGGWKTIRHTAGKRSHGGLEHRLAMGSK